MNITITVSHSETDKKIAALHREATRYKDVDWDKAIACLQEAAVLMRKNKKSIHEVDRWLRLPVFLQQAGRFDEAMQEFKQLLKEVKPRVKRELARVPYPTAVELHTHLNYYHIYDKMRMVCKRQKLVVETKEYQALYEQHKLIHAELRPIVERERTEQHDAYLAKRGRL